jgi:hypothetical protein
MGWRGFGFVHHSRTIFCRAVPNPNLTIRNFFIAVHLRERREGEAAEDERRHAVEHDGVVRCPELRAQATAGD